MTLEEVAASLPNGFHDAELQRFEMDYVHRTLRFDLVVWIGDDSRGRETYRSTRLTLDDVAFLVIEPPADQFVERHADSLPAFTPQGLRRVLPFFMEYTLRHPRSEVAERLIFHLSPMETGDDYWRPRLDVFSAEQKAAICGLLTFLGQELAGEHYESDFARARVVWACA